MKNIRSDYNFKRNNQILEDYLSSNLSYSDLAKKHNLSRQRIGAIIKDMTEKELNQRLNTELPQEDRETYKDRAVEVRESGNLETAQSMFEEVLEWDGENGNWKGAVDALGHLRIVHAKFYDETGNTEHLEDAEKSLEKAQKIIEVHPNEFEDDGRLNILSVHLASTKLRISKTQKGKEAEKTLEEALKEINSALENFPGSKAHQAWPLRTKGEILFLLGREEEALDTLFLAEKRLFEGYEEEIKSDDQAELKLKVWLSGIQLTLAKIAKETGKDELAKSYAQGVLSTKDTELEERRKEAEGILKEIE